MPYSTTISALDLSDGVGGVRVAAGYTWSEVGGARAVERLQEEVALDLTSLEFLSQTTPATFSYAGSLAPQPSPTWFIALWIQESARIAGGTGWLFRSGRFTTEPTSAPIEVILAPEQLIGSAELAAAVGTLPIASGSTTITSLTPTVVGADVAIVAGGTDTGLPAGVTFTYTATLVLEPSGGHLDVDAPFDIRLDNPSLAFTAGVGTGFVTFLLNVISPIILGEIAPRVKTTIKGLINAGILADVATRLNRGKPSTMPAGVVLSIRSVRGTTRPTAAGTESVIGVRAALGAFGGVLSKFPPLTGSKCFIASAASDPLAPEVVALKTWRDLWLRRRRGGPWLIAAYERFSPPAARFISRSPRRRAFVRVVVVAPAARVARFLVQRAALRR